jgi:CHC2 zinc finger/RepB DNA-primase from phage plasmid
MTARSTNLQEIRRYLAVLYNDAPASALVEVRFRLGDGMGRTFHRPSELDTVAVAILNRSRASDVFIGVVPRSRGGGTRADLVSASTVVWVDCDDQSSANALRRFQPAPSMVIASGTGPNRHAYWRLSRPISLDATESFNRRLALVLGADLCCTDPARILRPAGSLNHKTRRPTPVGLVRDDPDSRISALAMNEILPPLITRPMRVAVRGSTDPLLEVSPRVYVTRLTGLGVGRSGKIRCPFHDDTTPSLHVYEDPTRGWYCYGCGKGGSIYDLAALLWYRSSRGPEFLTLRRDLIEVFHGGCYPEPVRRTLSTFSATKCHR